MSNDEAFIQEIANRLIWHRTEIVQLTQHQYADAIGVSRARYSQWELGIQRLSIDGAQAIKKKFELSLDFMYFGDIGGLPMSLYKAWVSRLESEAS